MSKYRRVGAMSVAVALAVAACGSDDDGARPSESNSTVESATGESVAAGTSSVEPRPNETPSTAPVTSVGLEEPEVDPGGVLRIAHAAGIDTLDPHLTTSQVFNMYQFQIYDRLFLSDATNNVVSMLATSSEFSADGSSLQIGLRDDVVFHDGTPVDAAAVKASIERGKSLPGSTVANVLSGITAVEVVDDFSVRFSLDGAGPELLATLSTNAGAIVNPVVFDDPSVDLATAPPVAAGSGPYVVTASEPNVSTSYARAPEYWNDQAGRLAGMTVSYVPQGASRLAGLQAGDFDMVAVTSEILEEARALAESGAFDLDEEPEKGAARDLIFNVDAADLADIEVRRAIAMAINREELGLLYPCVEHTQTQLEGYWAYNPAITNLAYDPEGARKIVEDHGGVSFEVLVIAGSSFEQMATAVQSQLAEAGIEMTIASQEFAGLQQRLGSGDFEAVLQQMNQGVDPVDTLNRYFLGGYNLARGDFAEQLAAAVAPGIDTSLTQDERAPIYQEAFQMIADEQVFVPLCRGVFGFAYTTPLVGLDEMPGVGGTKDFTFLAVAPE